MNNVGKWLIIIILATTFTGCANLNYRPPVAPSTKLNPQKSFVYGRFSLDHDFMNKLRLALQLENKNNGKILSLKLLDHQQVYAVEIEPGIYELKGFVYALLGAVMEFETTKIDLPSQPSYLKEPITIEQGKAYYLGDYFGSSRRTGFLLTPYLVSTTFRGGIVGIEQNFSKTSKELKSVLPYFGNIELRPAWKDSITKLQEH